MVDVASTTIGLATSATGLFAGFVPDLAELRKATPNHPETVNDLRLGESVGLGAVIALGIGASLFTKSYMPITVAIILGIALVVLHESVLAQPARESQP